MYLLTQNNILDNTLKVSEGRWKWDEDLDLEFTSAFFTGVCGMWNIYILALIVLYAPTRKEWLSETNKIL